MAASDIAEAGKVADAQNAEAPGESDAKVLERARARLRRGIEFEEENRKHAVECLKFRNLEQWDPEVRNLREKDPEGARPCIVMDKTNQYLNQVINDYRQNRPAIKVRPMDDGDEEVAEVLQGIVRHIEDKSSADVAYDTAYEASVDGGFGYLRVLTEHCDEESFDQDIRIARIKNRFTVVLDPDRDLPHRPPRWGFVMEKMLRADFQHEFPDADPMAFDTDGKMYDGWVFEGYVVVAEYFEVVAKKQKLRLWPDGQKTMGEDIPEMYRGLKPVREREVSVESVSWKKLTAAEVLERNEWAGKYVPIVEFVGTELDIEGKSVKSGLLKQAMTPQAIHNYAASSFVEGVMLAPRASWVAAEGQIEGYEELYRTANRRSISVLPYKPVVAEGGIAVPPPQRVQPPGLSAGWMQTMQNTEHDIQASMGLYANTMLGQGDAQSGKQELIQQRRGDTGTFHYSDNAARSIRFLGTILLDLIPKIYDTERVVRIIGEDGETDEAALNPNQQAPVRKVRDEAGAIRKIYNLNTGRYDVAVSVGPAYATKRIEAVEWLTQLVQAKPELLNIAGDILFRNMDAPGAEQLADRMKALLPPQVQALEDADSADGPQVMTPRGPLSVQEAGQVIAQLEQAQQQAQAILESKEMAAKEAEAQKAATDAARLDLDRHKEAADQTAKAHEGERKDRELELKAAEVAISQYNAETARLKVEADERKREAEEKAKGEELTAQALGNGSLMESVVGAVVERVVGPLQEAHRPILEGVQGFLAAQAQPAEMQFVPDAEGRIAEATDGRRRIRLRRGPDGNLIGGSIAPEVLQ